MKHGKKYINFIADFARNECLYQIVQLMDLLRWNLAERERERERERKRQVHRTDYKVLV
jgi:hypothetical protein